MFDSKQEVEDLLALVDVVVINMGNEYNGKQDEYLTDMTDLFAQARERARERATPSATTECARLHSRSAPILAGLKLSPGPLRFVSALDPSQLEEFAKETGKTAVFRESGAQHFNAAVI